MKLAAKLQIGLSLPAVLLIGIGSFSLLGFGLINRQIATIYDDRIVPMEQLKQVSDGYAIAIIDAANKVEDERISNREALQKIEQAQQIIDTTWQDYKQTQFTPEEARLTQIIEQKFQTANIQVNALKLALQQGDRASLAVFDGGLYDTIDPLTRDLEKLINLQLRVAQKEREDATAIYRLILLIFVPILAISVLVIVSPLRRFISKTLIATLKETINIVVGATTEIATATAQQERIAAQQAASVQETTTTIDELKITAQQSAQQAEAMAETAQAVRSLSDKGSQAVNNTLGGMTQLQAQVSEIAEQINQLKKQTQQIGTIAQLVSEVSYQTNMLALNAAVEAVRAGDRGQGFRVVATEIRKLADRSQAAGVNINTLVGDLQDAIATTVSVAISGTETAQNSLNLAQVTTHTFAEIAAAIDGIARNNQQVSLNSQQQAQAVQQVADAIAIINRGAEETAVGIRQTRLGTQQLNKVTRSLQEMI
ncbi:MAG: methyl-accepting chemotaxis protein [Jaaginema sp. PMC 1079.18]|nr:methyl-accepting chemotaxis protein [Jaaginema sp. PMC 1080.18]MEC4853058.1 methyl-accepting chemotaxis protein [Jaaginema sp. PMC 1079.18]MEC4869034.1 methyl-accepting chemotaxis protein [Jaaginema sp. PMC 1078.18]